MHLILTSAGAQAYTVPKSDLSLRVLRYKLGTGCLLRKAFLCIAFWKKNNKIKSMNKCERTITGE